MTTGDAMFLDFLLLYLGPITVVIVFTIALLWLFKRAIRVLRRKNR